MNPKLSVVIPVYNEEKKEVHASLNDTAFYKKQKRVALHGCGVINPEDITEYIAYDGYRALAKALTEMTPEEVVNYLNKKCGMLGISELSSDCRDLTDAMNNGNEKAKLAMEMVGYRIKKYVGSYAAVLGGVDAIVFTGGIGEHSEDIRQMVMEDMEFLGAEFDNEKNWAYKGGIGDLGKPTSKVRILVVPTNEELSIARETKALTE